METNGTGPANFARVEPNLRSPCMSNAATSTVCAARQRELSDTIARHTGVAGSQSHCEPICENSQESNDSGRGDVNPSW